LSRNPATVPRLLTRRTYSALVLSAAIAFPAAAFAAAGGEASPDKRARRAHHPPALVAGPLSRPATSFRRAIRIGVRRIRAAERARLRRERREAFAALPGGVSQATLDAIGACESGGDPTAVSAGGTYRGKYQFDFATWESVGGSGDPAAASEAEQDYRAALVYSRAGSSPWPICG
jgi:soluble lytic murein transglycosylase-like protein